MVWRPVFRVGQYQGEAAEYQVSIRALEPTLWRGLEMGAHKELTTLAEGLRNSNSRFRRKAPE